VGTDIGLPTVRTIILNHEILATHFYGRINALHVNNLLVRNFNAPHFKRNLAHCLIRLLIERICSGVRLVIPAVKGTVIIV
jgi:hypothetical protein